MKTLIKIAIAAAALAAVSSSVAAKPFGHGTSPVQIVPVWHPKPLPFPQPLPEPRPLPIPGPVCLSCPPIDFGAPVIGGQFGVGY